MEPLILFGARGQALVLWEFLHLTYELVAQASDYEADHALFPAVPMLVGVSGISEFVRGRSADIPHFAIAIGNEHGGVRLSRHRQLIEMGLMPIRAVHPTSYVSRGATVGEGCQLLVRSVVGEGAILGDQVILNTMASVDHECRIGHGAHIGPGAHLAGRACVGDRTFVGTGALVLPGVTIGADCIIGAGAVVTNDIPCGWIAYGTPARPMRMQSVESDPLGSQTLIDDLAK